MEIAGFKIQDIQQGYREGKFSPTEITKAYLERIKELDKGIQAFIHLNEEDALLQAKDVAEKIQKKETAGLLEGIPVAVKDNICTKGLRTTCGSKMLEDFIPPYDATLIKKLKEAGAIIIGKTNMDEFAMGSSTENSAFATTKNPWDTGKVPGGSSGGSAAAVAAGFAPLAIGSDTGGSIRQPASFCGVVGLKPTYGLVSRYGLIAFASSLDQIGPLTKTVEDCALSLQAIQGPDSMDATSYKERSAENYLEEIKGNIKGLKVGVPKEFFQKGLHGEIAKAIDKSMKLLEEMGAELEEFSLPIMDTALSAYYIISSAEASANLARYDGVRYGYRSEIFEGINELMVNSRTEAFGKEVKRRIMMGTYVLSSGYYDAYYNKAMMLRRKIKDSFSKAFENYDVILSPTSPILPFGIGEKMEDPLEMYLADIYTVSINIAGLPAISIPCGFSNTKLPIGLQLIGKPYQENQLLKAAYHLEQQLEIDTTIPALKEV
ncbi:aspartyl/glutamyl-tRNA(Asn/Gln) amidotransferase subunit A [Natronincola peptidivorans]|uniref:Glutamyl-tRNA(Gln) amidotransferase subunit A n=1 Tax=Natronincola peptidivorans TaxID=426128 RepID=A0A1I0BUZ0_9FIRM|nr:Asp-tRNA(Asn)/Glu-tRNA(Gln) amidotransferase subunit GatA [Natronincola peptidivorans]SET10865.1 aspartyl/glutamyl-tRNA(Asn/Gln) amidotransferase subunit A [Natronincola peptidivorans]